MLVDLTERDPGDQERLAARNHLDPLDHGVGVRVLPAPQVVVPGPAAPMLGQPVAGPVPAPLEPGVLAVRAVGHGEERLLPQAVGTTWISNRSRIGTVTDSPPARWKT